MHWLKLRLKKLGITQTELSERLEEHGIYRSRQAISSWVQPDNDVPMLANPKEAQLLADALEWNLTEMLVAAGYQISTPDRLIPPELLRYVFQFGELDEHRLKIVLGTLAYSMEMLRDIDDEEMAKAEAEAESED